MSIKYIIRCAVASLALFVTASCDMSEIVDSESLSWLRPAAAGDSVDSDIIAFTMAADTSTKAQDVTTANITAFEVTAFTHGMTTNPYFNAVAFTGGSGTFASDTPHYWPASGALDFYAWSVGSATGQVVKNSYKSFTVTPSANPALQADLVFACSGNRTKAGASGGVIPLAFAKTMSRVSVKVKNTSSDYKFQVTGWKVGFVATIGTFTYSGSGTSAGTQLPVSMWSGNTTRSADRSYSSTFSTVNVAANASTPMTLAGEMVLVPQSGAAATGYASASTGAALNGSYVAVRMTVLDALSDFVVLPETWGIWPAAVAWEPGRGYAYTIDLAGGGYFESNRRSTDAALDAVFGEEMAEPHFITPAATDIFDGGTAVITMATSANMHAGTAWGVRLVGPRGSQDCPATLTAAGAGRLEIGGLAAGSYIAYPYVTVDGVNYGYEYGGAASQYGYATFTVLDNPYAVTGRFSVSATRQVRFSRGNLRATTTDLGAHWTWAFAEHQWEKVGGRDQGGAGTPTGNNLISGNGTLSAAGTVDLFAWSTSATYYGIYNSTSNDDYAGDFVDWGTVPELAAAVGTGWRTLTQSEWYYLFVTRTTTSGMRFVKAGVNGVYGLIVFPDDWQDGYHPLTASYINNNAIAFTNVTISAAVWESDFEAHGAVFLPVAGQRHVNNGYVEYPNGRGHYWSSTPYEAGTAYRFYFTGSSSEWSYGVGSSRRFGYSVRLVRDIE